MLFPVRFDVTRPANVFNLGLVAIRRRAAVEPDLPPVAHGG